MPLNLFDLFFFSSLVLFFTSFLFSILSKSTNKQGPNSRFFFFKLSSSSTQNGPPSYPIIGCLISFYKNRKRLLEWYTELLSESPTQTIVVSRLGAGKVIVTANPDNVEYILKTNFPNFPKGKPLAEILGDLLGNGIFNVDGDLWAAQRKLASHEFTTKSLKEFVVKTLEEEVQQRLIPLLHSASQQGNIIDLQEVLKRFTYDTICKVSMGIDPNCLDLSVPIPPLIVAFEKAAEISAMRAASPIYMIWKVKRALNLGSEKQLKQSINKLHQLVESIISTKQQGENHHQDLLSRFLSAGYQGELARDMVISFIMAGRDTTAAAMTWLFWLLSSGATHTAAATTSTDTATAIDTATATVVTATTRDNIRNELASKDPLISYEAVKNNMRYLHACLCEAMRLYPPVVWDSKHAINDDVLPDGTRVTKGDRVTYFPYGMGRMESIWGEDRFQFNPDRWFQEGTRNLKMVNPYEYPIFQAGPRVCLGKDMAFIQMKYVMASILTRFDFHPVSSEPPIFVPLLTAHMAGGFKVRVKEIMKQ